MSYMNDPREMVIIPESGVTFEQDNRVESMYQWGARIVDLCDLPVSEYMKPMTVIVYGNGGGEWEPIDPTLKTENVKIWFRILKNGNDVNGEEQVLSAGENGETIWTACWEWIGSFSNEVRVAAVVQTDSNSYTVSAVLKDNEEKKHEETIVEITPEETVESYKSYGVASTETPAEEVTATTYTEVVESTKVNFEVSSAETIVYLTLKLNGVNSYTNSEMRYGDEIPFSEVNINKEGYEFTHWVDSKGNKFTGTTMPAYDLTLTAKYEAKKCVVNFVFMVDDVEEFVSSTTVNYGSKVSKFPSTNKAGYVFNGWEPAKDTIIKDDTTFIGYFKSIEYVVVWRGFTGEDYPNGVLEQTYKYGDLLIQPVNPEKEGYTFVKWNRTIPEKVTSNLDFNAIFSINSYTITFNKEWNGVVETISAYTKNYGETIKLPSIPSEEGYTYTEWLSDYTGTTVPAYDVVYRTVKTAKTYTLSYYADGIKVNEESYDYMEEIKPYNYVKEGYTVTAWSPELPKYMPSSNLDVFCETSVNKYELIFIDNNGDKHTVMAEYGTTIGENLPVIEGFTFVIPDDVANTLVGVENPEINVELVVNNYKVNITIDGEVIDVTELPYGTNVKDYINENFPADEGYTIIIDSNHEYVPADDSLVVNVSYKANVWVLTYSTNGSENDLNGNVDVEYGAVVANYLPETDQVGYDFNGWFIDGTELSSDYTMPNNDITVNGIYNIEMYNVSVVDGDIVLINKAYVYKTPISSVLNEQEVVNYVNTLVGYDVEMKINGNTVDENMVVTEDLVINIEKTAKMFTLTFMNGDNVISTTSIAYGTKIEYPTIPDKEEDGIEYVFAWDDKSYDGKPMPAQDLVISGSYAEKSKGVIYYGSFVILKDEFSYDNISEYFDESQLNTKYYGSMEVEPCIGNGFKFNFVYPPYEPFIDLPRGEYMAEQQRYYEPSTLLIPVSVIDKYKVEVLDSIDTDNWNKYVTNKEIVVIDGVEYYFYVYCTDSLVPTKLEQTIPNKLKLTEKKSYKLTFKNGEEIISEEVLYSGNKITYPLVDNIVIDGEEFTFVWEDESYNGMEMPENDLVIMGSYVKKEEAPIYYGSFVILKDDYSSDNVSKYFNENDLNTSYYNTITVDSCVGKESAVEFMYPPYEPFVSMSRGEYMAEQQRYYEPSVMLIPVKVIEKYNISLKDSIDTDIWEKFITDKKEIIINGDKFYFYVYRTDSLIPTKSNQTIPTKLKLTEK